MKRSFIREILEHTDSDTISFAGGLPDPGLFPVEELRRAGERALGEAGVYQYATSSGLAPLREWIARWYSDGGFPTEADEILITSGSQQALDIISRYHTGRAITIESPSYLGAQNLFDLNNISTDPIPLHPEGIDLPGFAASIRQTRLAYLIPDFQNPTGSRYRPEHRAAIARDCEQHDALLIEDAPYSELYFDAPIPSISRRVPTRSYRLGTLSKILAPGLRIGWIRADRTLLTPLIAYKEATDLHTSPLTQSIAWHYLRDTDTLRQHIRQIRSRYHAKMTHFADTLTRQLPAFDFTRPEGGMFLYGTLPDTDTRALLRRCLPRGVVFVPGAEFGGSDDAIRFNYTHSSMTEIEEGIGRIREAMEAV